MQRLLSLLGRPSSGGSSVTTRPRRASNTALHAGAAMIGVISGLYIFKPLFELPPEGADGSGGDLLERLREDPGSFATPGGAALAGGSGGAGAGQGVGAESASA